MSQAGFVRRRGDTWTAYWTLPTTEGPKQRTKGGFRTKKDAQTYLSDAIASIAGGTFAEPSKLMFIEFVNDRWLPSRQLQLKPATINSYEVALRIHVFPVLGALPLQQITVEHLDRLYTRLAKKLKPKSVRNIHVMLHKIFHDAVRKQLIPRNPATAADPPKVTRADQPEMTTWSPADLQRFFEDIRSHRLGAAFILGATTGLRRGEILGLRWQDLDLDERLVFVNQNLVSVAYQLHLGTPKTTRSRRQVAIDPETIRMLRLHQTAQQAERAMVGAGYRDQGFVFAKVDGGPIHPDLFSKTFERTVKRLGLQRIRLHDLRHTHATLGLAAGIPVKVMSDRLGHATTAFTMDVYTHVIPKLQHDAAEQIAGLVFGVPPSSSGTPGSGGEAEAE